MMSEQVIHGHYSVPDRIQRALQEAIPRFDRFRCPEQAEIAARWFEGKPLDILGILPTGMGKSLCFLLPTYLWKQELGRGMTVVVSPILALMQDQVDAVERLTADVGEFRLNAAQLNSNVSLEERKNTRARIGRGEVDVLYLGPETLVQPWTYEMLADAARNRILRGLVVDEAHIIEEWGDQFRTSFKRLGPIRRILADACQADAPLRTLVLTATLPREDRVEVLRALGFPEGIHEVEHRAIRSEHHLFVKHAKTRVDKVRMLVDDAYALVRTGAGIVYCAKRADCEDVAEILNSNGLGPAQAFHGGTPPPTRREILRAFQRDRCRIVVATDAFGLGVDKQNVRWVLHFAHPDSIDQYYQEIGRAGRDGGRCDALLYYCPADKGIAKRNQLAVLTSEKFDDRFRSMRQGGVPVRPGPSGKARLLIEEETIPNYVNGEESGGEVSARLHTNWNYAVLVRAEQLGWLKLGPDVLHEVAVRRGHATIADLEAMAPNLAAAGLVAGLRTDATVTLALGDAARKSGADVRRLQQEVFDLLTQGKLLFPEDPSERLWNTRILVEDIVDRHTHRIHEDQTLRVGKQRRGAERVDDVGRYAKTRTCRRSHFFEAYGYASLCPSKGCGCCDVCGEAFDPCAKRFSDLPPLAPTLNGFTAEAVYAKELLDRLVAAGRADRVSLPVVADRRWLQPAALLKRARKELLDVPIIFADAANPDVLRYWAVLRRLELEDGRTTYWFSHLSELKAKHASSLRLSSSGGTMERKRSHTLVETPSYVKTAAQAR
mgnify:FL=1